MILTVDSGPKGPVSLVIRSSLFGSVRDKVDCVLGLVVGGVSLLVEPGYERRLKVLSEVLRGARDRIILV
jgi:hypothetical protein